MHSVCRCSLPVWRRSFLKKGTPRDLFLPRPGSASGRIWPKNNNTCKGLWVLHAYQVSSKSIKRFWRSRKCEKFTPDGRRRTDGRTDDGRCAMTIAHSSLQLRWAKKCDRRLVGGGLTSHLAIFQLYSDRRVVQFPNFDLLPGTQCHWQLGVFSVLSLPRHGHRDYLTDRNQTK